MRCPSLFWLSHVHVTGNPHAQATEGGTEGGAGGRGFLVRAKASESQAYPDWGEPPGSWLPHEARAPRVLKLSSLHFTVVGVYSFSASGHRRLMRAQPCPSPGFF